MELKRLGRKTYYVTGAFHVGVYVIREDDMKSVCLIDTGVDEETATEIDELLIKNNMQVTYIINTHFHADHVGGNSYFKEKYDCMVVSDQMNAALISNYDICPSIVWGAVPISELLNNYYYARSCECRNYKEVRLPRGITVGQLPGHCITMLYVKTDDDVMFVGDAVIDGRTLESHPVSYIYDIKKYLGSLDKLLTLPAKIYVPYHSDEVEDISGLVKVNRENVLENLDIIRKICEAPHTLDEIYEEFSNIRGLRPSLYRYVVEGGIIRTYMTYLYNKGELSVNAENNHITWCMAK